MQPPVTVIRKIGLVDYQTTFDAMKLFTEHRDSETPDELWLLQHPSVYTQGRAGKPEHILQHTDIPIVQADRGGQVTYHGPGQLTVYILVDLKRNSLGVRDLVSGIERAIVALMADLGVDAAAKDDAPGVYVEGRKLASLGLRIRNGKSFHGLALNIDMDMQPFLAINPCGYQGLVMTQISELVEPCPSFDWVQNALTSHLVTELKLTTKIIEYSSIPMVSELHV